MSPREERTHAYAQHRAPTPVDRFGVWLSAVALRRHVGPLEGRRIGDFGCGFHATFARSVLPTVDHAVLADVALADDLKANPKVTALEGALPGVLSQVADHSLDVVFCVSVLEHLWEPEEALSAFVRVLTPGGVCLINVPSWRGKRVLEFSAFVLGWSPREEMNDHKQYYDPRELWPLLVRAGFRPDGLRVFRHKFGLNTFAVCRAPTERSTP